MSNTSFSNLVILVGNVYDSRTSPHDLYFSSWENSPIAGSKRRYFLLHYVFCHILEWQENFLFFLQYAYVISCSVYVIIPISSVKIIDSSMNRWISKYVSQQNDGMIIKFSHLFSTINFWMKNVIFFLSSQSFPYIESVVTERSINENKLLLRYTGV